MSKSSKDNMKNHQEYRRNKVAAKSTRPSHRKLASTSTGTSNQPNVLCGSKTGSSATSNQS